MTEQEYEKIMRKLEELERNIDNIYTIVIDLQSR